MRRSLFLFYVVLVVVGLAAPWLDIYPVYLMTLYSFAIFACAFNLLLGFGGMLSFGHAAYFGLGVIEGLTKVFYPQASNTVIFIIMVIVLLVRPAGLFGRRA